MDVDFIHLAENRSLWQADVSMEMKFLISNFYCGVNVAFFLLGHSPASAFYLQTFRYTLFSIFIGPVNKKNNWDEIARVFIQV